jgi:hypothetical protein
MHYHSTIKQITNTLHILCQLLHVSAASSWHLISRVFCDLFYCILIGAFCWFLKNMECKKMQGMNNKKLADYFISPID